MTRTSHGQSAEQVKATDPGAFNRPSWGAYLPPEYVDRNGAQINRPMQTSVEPAAVAIGGRVLHAG